MVLAMPGAVVASRSGVVGRPSLPVSPSGQSAMCGSEALAVGESVGCVYPCVCLSEIAGVMVGTVAVDRLWHIDGDAARLRSAR